MDYIYNAANVVLQRLVGNASSSQVEKARNHYTITYTYNMTEYKVKCKKNKSRNTILHIYDENDNQVFDILKPYMGPFLDFHGIMTSPKDLGYKKLSFELLNGQIKTFYDDDIIIV